MTRIKENYNIYIFVNDEKLGHTVTVSLVPLGPASLGRFRGMGSDPIVRTCTSIRNLKKANFITNL